MMGEHSYWLGLVLGNSSLYKLARMFRKLMSRDREDGCATGQPQGLGPEAYLFSTSRGSLVLSLPKEQLRTPGMTARSRSQQVVCG
jgi:hypothetical protein